MKKALYVDLSLIRNKDEFINKILALANNRNVTVETVNSETKVLVLIMPNLSAWRIIGVKDINDTRLKILSVGYKFGRTRTAKILKYLS